MNSMLPDNQRFIYLVACFDAANNIIGYAPPSGYWVEPVPLKDGKVYLLRNGATARAKRLNTIHNPKVTGTWAVVPALVSVDNIFPPKTQRYTLVMDQDAHEYLIPIERYSEWAEWINIPQDDPLAWEPPQWAKRIEGFLSFENVTLNGQPL